MKVELWKDVKPSIRLSLFQFIEQYKGRAIDFDGVSGVQCVGLYRCYCEAVWGTPHLGALGANGGAKDLYFKHESLLQSKYCDKIEYRPGFIPKAGDVAIWDVNPGKNPYGHVAIVTSATADIMEVFEQDGINPGKGAYLIEKPYTRVLGFLRLKEQYQGA